MRQTDWTKGPWTLVKDVPTLVNGNFRTIADTACGRQKWLVEDVANARLIAKSPEMAELLRAYANGDYHDAAAGLMAAFDEAVERLLNELGPR